MEMTRTVAMLLALTVAACGSASKAGPKTTNPPLKTAEPKPEPKPDPAEDVEVDGFTLKIKKLDFKITMTTAPWQGKSHTSDDGQFQVILERPDLGGMMFLGAMRAKDTSAQKIVDSYRADLSQKPELSNFTAVTAENAGRYAFTADGMEDGKASRVYIAASP